MFATACTFPASSSEQVPPASSKSILYEATKPSIGNVNAVAYLNLSNVFVSPSNQNFFGELHVGNCILDTSCASHLIAINSLTMLDEIFTRFKTQKIWNFAIGKYRGSVGTALTLIVRSSNQDKVPVRLATDHNDNKILGYAKGYRFLLSGDDIRHITQDVTKMECFTNFTDRTQLEMNSTSSSTPRLSSSLIGTAILNQSIAIYFRNMAFFLGTKEVMSCHNGTVNVNLGAAAVEAQYQHMQLSRDTDDVEHLCLDHDDFHIEGEDEVDF